MKILSSTSLTAIFLIKIISSLMNEQSNRLLISLKTPIWFSEGESNGTSVRYKKVDYRALHDAIKFYENPENMIDLDCKQDDNKNWYFTGHIGDLTTTENNLKKLHEIWGETFNNHPIIRTNVTESKNHAKRATHKINDQLIRRPKYTLPPYDGPDPIYPRILLFVNYFDTFFTSDREIRFYQLLVYLVSFWNGVDMKFTEFEHPRIKFHITGIIIGNNKWSAPWLQVNKSSPNSDSPQYTEAFYDFRSFVLDKNPLPGGWDIFLSQSNIKFKNNANDGEPTVTGMSLVGTTCNFRPNAVDGLEAILINDDLSFRGIDVAAHEIGHFFGAIHDGNVGALCDDYQFIMTPLSVTKVSSVETWSWCSKFQILQHLRNHSRDCWQHTPVVDKIDEVPEILPGHLMSLDSQCDSHGFKHACEEYKNHVECDHLYCSNSNFLLVEKFGNCEDEGPPLDGTICGQNRHCKNKKCVQWKN